MKARLLGLFHRNETPDKTIDLFNQFIKDFNSMIDAFHTKHKMKHKKHWSLEFNQGTVNTPGAHYRITCSSLQNTFTLYLQDHHVSCEEKEKMINSKKYQFIVVRDEVLTPNFFKKEMRNFLQALKDALAQLSKEIDRVKPISDADIEDTFDEFLEKYEKEEKRNSNTTGFGFKAGYTKLN